MASGLVSGLTSGLGASAAGGAAGAGAAGAGAAGAAGAGGAASGAAGLGSQLGGAMSSGAIGDIAKLFSSGGGSGASGAGGNAMQGATAAADPSNTKGGILGTGLFGNDQYNPNPSSYAPATGGNVAQAAMPRPQQSSTPIALALMQQLPITDPRNWQT